MSFCPIATAGSTMPLIRFRLNVYLKSSSSCSSAPVSSLFLLHDDDSAVAAAKAGGIFPVDQAPVVATSKVVLSYEGAHGRKVRHLMFVAKSLLLGLCAYTLASASIKIVPSLIDL